MGHQHIDNVEENFTFPSKLKSRIMILIITGFVLFAIGLILAMQDNGHHDTHGDKGDHHAYAMDQSVDLLASQGDDAEFLAFQPEKHEQPGHESEEHDEASEQVDGESHADHSTDDHQGGTHHAATTNSDHVDAGGHQQGHIETPVWLKRIKVSLWHNSLYVLGLSVIGIFFVAIQYVSSSGWSVQVKRVSEAFSTFIPIAGVILIAVFFWAKSDLFHWTHTEHGMYQEGHENYDSIIAGKAAMFFGPGVKVPGIPYFFILRLFLIIAVWTAFAYFIRKEGYKEDGNGGIKHYRRSVIKSGLFIIFFGLTISISSWDWIMSIDTHWFSTMFGWYAFASWFVAGLSTITLAMIYLKEFGYLKNVNENHFHDLGKYIFAFSIFWTYVWFSQFLLIYYANIPEETVYFWERLNSDQYYTYFFVTLIMNFVFPVLGLMTRDAKRMVATLKIVCTVVIMGHWLDFFLMIVPGTLKAEGTVGLLEIGLGMIFFGSMVFMAFVQMSKVPLIQKNHPMLEESLHHHI